MNFGHTVFCDLLDERKLMRPSLDRLEVIFDGGLASKADQSLGVIYVKILRNHFQLWRPDHHQR